jgi:hypothetical protein
VARLIDKPKFAKKKELARWVREEDRLGGNRPAVSAFIDPPSSEPDKEHLSVNSLEVETLRQIADYYRNAFQGGVGPVSICTRTVEDYTEAGKKANIQIAYDRSAETWQFTGRSRVPEPAYKHRPVQKRADGLSSPSHCGVEFIRMMDEHAKSKFARRLSDQKFHWS